MKKKPSIREQREQQAAQARQAHQKKDLAKQEELRIQRAAEEAAAREKEKQEYLRKLSESLNPVRQRTLSEEKKSTAKAAGLKSTFIMGGSDLLMTSFGKGNAAIPEKKVAAGTISDLVEKPAFTVTPEKDLYFLIDGRVRNASTDNPLYHAPEQPKSREDLIHARSALEKLYYGDNFQDNIHIQAVYSILDVEKILSIHINNIVYMLNNFLREDKEDITDFVGYLNGNTTYEKFIKEEKYKELSEIFHKLCTAKQMGYLNLEVTPAELKKDKNGKPIKKRTDPNTIKITEEEFYYMLCSISTMRHMLAHGNPTQNIYLIEGFGKGNKISDVLTRLYRDRIRELNNGFLDKAGKNLNILFKAFSVTDKEKKASYVRDYYDFTVRKTYKNTGFSIKLLREHMTAEVEEAFVLRDKKYDSVRGKLYPFTDYAIFRYYQENPAEAEELVASLRASFSEKEKDAVYAREAARIWPKKQVGDLILHHILPEMSGDTIKTLTPDKDVTADMLQSVLVSAEATDFSKMVYMLTLFINGKEINDLLTTLIHQFENIDAFSSVMKSQGLRTGFTKDFRLFGMSARVAEELRMINSFARMTKEAASAKEIMYVEAFHVLGIKADEDQLLREVKDILDPEKSGKGSQKRGIRNFIANNVIESVRFKYLIRYGNVKKLKKLAQNPVMVAFVLKDIPDDQIRRYYVDLGETRETDVNAMRAGLTQRLTGFSFEDISDVRQNDRAANQQEQREKQQKQALVRLYLTVLYLALKNLVYINSRYFLAFHCVERDRKLLNPEFWNNKDMDQHKYEPEYGFMAFAKQFLDQYPQKKRVAAYMDQNFANADEWAIRAYRNKIEHLDAIRNADRYIGDVKEIHSWFELYHYIMQRRIIDQFDYESKTESKKNLGTMIISKEELNPKTLAYFNKVNTYGSYCKDFVKALNVPFAYNLPRYKNLSVDELFDKNRPSKKKGDGNKLENDE